MAAKSSILAVLAAVSIVTLSAKADPFYDGAKTGIELTQLKCAGVASTTNTGVTVAEAATDVILTTVTISKTLIATTGSAEGESAKILDFDAGAFTVLDAVADLSVVSSAGATNVFVVAFGTAAASDAADLTGTEVDIIPSTSIDTTAGTVTTNAFRAVLAAPANFNGTATAKELYLNYGIAQADMNANVTNVITGTLKIRSTKAIDNQ
jgi:hypothetical protein